MSNFEDAPICPYCGEISRLEDSSKVYNGKSYGYMYICKRFPVCDAYVGVHKGTTKPLGRLANKELREWKMKAHAIIDPIWQNKTMTRYEVYKMLQHELGLTVAQAHIGEFDVAMCKRVVEKFSPQQKLI